MKNKARGCLLGQFIGDSLGSQVEFADHKLIRRIYPDGVREMRDGGVWRIMAGQITDDSEMALALARSIIKEKGFDADRVRAAYRDWLKSDPFDVGGTVGSALCGRPNPQSQANGALMRVSPLGIWGANAEREVLHKAAGEDSLLTHINPVCVQINQIFASLISEAITTDLGPRDLYGLIETAPEKLCPEAILPQILQAAEAAKEEKPVMDERSKGWVLIAFQNALYQLLHAPDFEEALVDTINGGGDTDTNAAICGALMGALYGAEGIPERWVKTILKCRPDRRHNTSHPRPKKFWAVDALELADGLLGERL